MTKNYHDIILALAGICQSAYLVQQLSHYGQCPVDAFKTSLSSLLNLKPPSILAVFGNQKSNIKCGLETLLGILNSSSSQGLAIEVTHYTMSLIGLERKLHKNPLALGDLANRIGGLNRQIEYYSLESDKFLSLIAEIYVDIISPLGSRIQVSGSAEILKNINTQNKVRAILLAGIRSAVLWKQVGGHRWQLMFFRNRLMNEAQLILKSLANSSV
ncbi:High frequency lysogenization protein HflD [Candidatus Erwinia haradaeae]|uniref:High frequency lysogenization protein HflD homolog n=1 Tax=Candidatus Erwinia haradaeae TaxID=1922217 RepID=A0A451DLQ9_9GAMM|nr:high frequency lysogenization protein HflD [Candidatus Erwinia haradaeae]VFP87669.1 High frequency lysogenization protein HflD [Candidatus Erwinia haradaeae]